MTAVNNDHGGSMHFPADPRVSDEMVRERATEWHTFTRFATYGIVSVVVLLILMALFLL
ncbi:aa3-type cytochrome c oxidase subunit IV [Azospirillum sp. A39]|uniref:aa3-type cytochrome c oxidase subunit IV n=1 Tax=Azospirillum sp. A39 TaxID=3462279 RepID=UPI0040461645